jgi:hypothetical protein
VEKQFTEEEIANRIIDLHDNAHLGFRRIAHKLSNEGIEISKDKAWRLYNKYKTLKPSPIEVDKELGELKNKEKKARKSFELMKHKNEIRRNIVAFAVQRLMEDYDERRRIFTNKDRLLRFARKTLRVTDPATWTKFSEYCERQGIELAKSLSAALGPQEVYEEQMVSDERLSLEVYLASRMRHYLNTRENQAKENDSTSEQKPSEENETNEYTDDEGYVHITIPN